MSGAGCMRNASNERRVCIIENKGHCNTNPVQIQNRKIVLSDAVLPTAWHCTLLKMQDLRFNSGVSKVKHTISHCQL